MGELRLYRVQGNVEYKDSIFMYPYNDVFLGSSKRKVRKGLKKEMRKQGISKLEYIEIEEFKVPGYKISLSPLEKKI